MDENQLTGGSDEDHSSDDDLISAIKMHYPAAVVGCSSKQALLIIEYFTRILS